MTEFDLAVSGIAEVQYIKVESRNPEHPDSSATLGADIDAVDAFH